MRSSRNARSQFWLENPSQRSRQYPNQTMHFQSSILLSKTIRLKLFPSHFLLIIEPQGGGTYNSKRCKISMQSCFPPKEEKKKLNHAGWYQISLIHSASGKKKWLSKHIDTNTFFHSIFFYSHLNNESKKPNCYLNHTIELSKS